MIGAPEKEVADGLGESFNSPSGNATGFTLLTNLMEPKRVGLLHELSPSNLVGALVNPNFPPAARQLREIEEATRRLDQRLFAANAQNDMELDAALASVVHQRVGGI